MRESWNFKTCYNALVTVHAHRLVQPQVSMGTRASNGGCSDAVTLSISDWLFHLEGGTILPYCALQFLPFISIGAGPDWLIGSTGRIPGGPVCFFCREGLCCHATGLNYAVPRLPAIIAAPLFLFIIFLQPILLFSPDHISNKFSIDN